jgi:excisionase family DNA binding protein
MSTDIRERLLLNIKEVAALTGLAVGSIYHLVSQKRIPVVRLSARCIRFRRSDLEKWIDGLSQPTRDEKD